MKKRNKITLNELEKVIDIIDKKNIKQTDEYDYFRIIKENIFRNNFLYHKITYFTLSRQYLIYIFSLIFFPFFLVHCIMSTSHNFYIM